MNAMQWVRKVKGACEWVEKLLMTPDDPLEQDSVTLLADEQLNNIEDRAESASIATQYDVRLLVTATRRQNEKIERALSLLGEALRGDEVIEERVADALHTLRTIAPSTPAARSAVARLLRYMEKPMSELFTERELEGVFAHPTNPLGYTSAPTLMQAYAALLTMNQGGDVSRPTHEFTQGGPYGRFGLTDEEMRMLCVLSGFVNGWMLSHEADGASFDAALLQEVERASVARAAWSQAGAEGALGKPQNVFVRMPAMRLTVSHEAASAMENIGGVTVDPSTAQSDGVVVSIEPKTACVVGTLHVKP